MHGLWRSDCYFTFIIDNYPYFLRFNKEHFPANINHGQYSNHRAPGLSKSS